MNLNISKLQKAIDESQKNKLDIALRCGIDRKTIENVLSGRDPKVSTIAKLADELGIKIGWLFDEEPMSIRQSGRDYVENGDINHGAATSELAAENAKLKTKLIEAQDRIIELLANK